MTTETYADIPSIVLDPVDDATLLTQMHMRVLNATSGRLNSVKDGSVLAALFEAMTYAMAYQRWYLNQLPAAIAIEMMRFSGIKRSAGTYATGTVSILLSSVRSTAVLVSSGTFLPLATNIAQGVTSGSLGYVTTQDLLIPAGDIEGQVPIRATVQGSSMNLAPFQLTIAGSALGMPYINSIFVRTPITGGSDLEPMYDYIKRVQVELRSNETLVTTNDYEVAAKKLGGSSSVVKAIGLLDAGYQTGKPGHVTVFLGYNDGTLPSSATCSDIRSQMQQRCFAASYVWVKPYDQVPTQVDITAQVDQHSDVIVNDIFEKMSEYLTPGKLIPGSTILHSELIYVTRQVFGVLSVAQVLTNKTPYNMVMSNPWTIPRLDFMFITLVDREGFSRLYSRGNGLPVEDVRGMVL